MTDQELKDLVASLAIAEQITDAGIRELRESQQKTDEQLKETDKQLKEQSKRTDRQLKELGKRIGGLRQ